MGESRTPTGSIRWAIGLTATVFSLLAPGSLCAADERPYDVVVYGGTPAGIAAAVQAARGGASVALVEPTAHVGGLVTSGLSHVDYRTYEGVTGFYLEFTKRVEAYYRDKYGEDSEQLAISRMGTHGEPHVNELVFEQMLQESGRISVRKNLRLNSVDFGNAADSVLKDPPQRSIARAIFVDREGRKPIIAGRVFIDATYEGDLMAKAGVPYRVGREGSDEYGESLAPENADDQLQGYNFRAIMTQDPANRVAIEKPAKYDREKFVGILELFEDGRLTKVFDYPSKCVFKAQIPTLPNGKYDINDVSRGPVRLSLPGEQLAWPDGDEATRRKIWERHRDWQVGLLYFLQHDEAVPQKIRDEALAWGWARDEFTDNDNFPWQLYVREARRMASRNKRPGEPIKSLQDSRLSIFTERFVDASSDGVRARFVPDAIAMGDYGPNCHGTAHEGSYFGGKHVGEFYKSVAPYQVPYGCMLSEEVSNLIVPVACASSHVGFCALRLEPIWSSMGQAAGAAAALAKEQSVHDVRRVSAGEIQRTLHASGAATIYVSDVLPGDEAFEAVQWFGSQGGLHGLQPADGREYGTRGKNEIGQYYAGYPGHAFEPDAKAAGEAFLPWIDQALDEPHSSESGLAALRDRVERGEATRGEVATALYRFYHHVAVTE